MSNPNQKALDFFKAAHEKYKKDDHPAHKHLKKVIGTIEKGGSPTEVLKNVVHAHCFDCSHDSADAAGSHPKKCTDTACPFYAHRPGASKTSKESSPDVKAKRQEVAANARSKRKLTVKEAMEALDEGADKVISSKKGRILYSYDTPVAIEMKDGTCYKTADKFSVTTSKHINKFLDGKSAEVKPQKWFDNLL